MGRAEVVISVMGISQCECCENMGALMTVDRLVGLNLARDNCHTGVGVECYSNHYSPI